MKTIFIALVVLVVGCKKEEAAPAPAPTPAVPAAPAADTAGKSATINKIDVPTKPAAEAVAPEAAKPKKLSEMDSFDLMDAVKAAGWESGGAGGMSQGAWSSTNLDATKDGVKAKITFLKPTGEPEDTKSTMKLQTPKDAAPEIEKRGGAVLLRDDAMLAVEVADKNADAKALLDAIVAKLPLAK